MIKKISLFIFLTLSLIACDPADLQRALDTLGESTTLTDQEVSLGIITAVAKGELGQVVGTKREELCSTSDLVCRQSVGCRSHGRGWFQ